MGIETLGAMKEVLDQDEQKEVKKKGGKPIEPTPEQKKQLGEALGQSVKDLTEQAKAAEDARQKALAKRVPAKFGANVSVTGKDVVFELKSVEKDGTESAVNWRSFVAMQGTREMKIETAATDEAEKDRVHFDDKGVLRLPESYTKTATRDEVARRFVEVAQTMLTKDDLAKLKKAQEKFKTELPKLHDKERLQRLTDYKKLEQAVADAQADQFEHAMERLKLLVDELKQNEAIDVMAPLGGWDAWSKKQTEAYQKMVERFDLAIPREVKVPEEKKEHGHGHGEHGHEEHGDHGHGPKTSFFKEVIYNKDDAAKSSRMREGEQRAFAEMREAYKEAEKERYDKMTKEEKGKYWAGRGQEAAGMASGAVAGTGIGAVMFFKWGYRKAMEFWKWLTEGGKGGGGGHGGGHGGDHGGGHH